MYDIKRNLSNSKEKPLIIAGPCAIESRRQTLDTVSALSKLPVDMVRGGLWKPRTRPGCFEGAGNDGLAWLLESRDRTGLPFSVEVALPEHVETALAHGVDAVWIGARTTANPFAVQALADALRGVDIPVLVKNPICPELSLWLGALERFDRMNVGPLAAIHRGFSLRDNDGYRYHPVWEIPLEFRQHTDIPLICDPSHISGLAAMVTGVARQALDFKFDGLIIETHINPPKALSDAQQQLTPQGLMQLLTECGLMAAPAPVAVRVRPAHAPSRPVAAAMTSNSN